MSPKDDKYDLGLTERLRTFIDDNGLKPRESKTSYIFTCPKCDKEEKLWVYKESGQFVCWVCSETHNFRGRPEYALSALTGHSVSSVKKHLYGEVSPTLEMFFDFALTDFYSDDETFEDIPNIEQIPTVFWGPGCIPIDHPLAKAGADYLSGRGISLETAKKYGIHYSGARMRVLFPIQYQGRLMGWQGRAIGVTEYVDPETGELRKIPKALTQPEGLRKERLVCFADQLTGSDQVIICEGPVDAIKFDLCSPDGVKPAGNIATLGKGVSEAQINLIRYSGANRVYIALDPDAASSIERLVKELSPYMEVFVIEVPSKYQDFGEMPMEEVLQAYKATRQVTGGCMYLYLDDSDVTLWRKNPNFRT